MGNTANQANKAKRISQIGGIPSKEFKRVEQIFRKASRGDMKLDYKEFAAFYSELTGISSHGLNSKIKANEVFHAIDLDNNRYVSFDEFVIAYILLRNPGEPFDIKMHKFLKCYFGGYVPDHIGPSDSRKIEKSLRILCENPMSSHSMFRNNHLDRRSLIDHSHTMGHIPQMGLAHMMGQGMRTAGQGMYMMNRGMTSNGMYAPNSVMHYRGMSSQMHDYPYSGGYQQMHAIPTDQFIQSIIGNPEYINNFGY